jgi:hypothetical protein
MCSGGVFRVGYVQGSSGEQHRGLQIIHSAGWLFYHVGLRCSKANGRLLLAMAHPVTCCPGLASWLWRRADAGATGAAQQSIPAAGIPLPDT